MQSLFSLKKASAILPLMDRHAHFYRLTDMRVRYSKPTDMTICPYRPTHMRTYSSIQEWASEEITFVYILIYILIWHTLFKVAVEFHVTEKKCRSAKIVNVLSKDSGGSGVGLEITENFVKYMYHRLWLFIFNVF